MKKNIIVCLIGSMGLLLASCGDFLEPKANSEYVPEDATSMDELLLGEAYARNDISNLNIFLNLMDDDLTVAPYQDAPTGFDVNLYFAPYTWQPNLYVDMKSAGNSNTDLYRAYYSLILGCNAVIDYMVEDPEDQEKINYVLGQAHALRGFYYFTLVNLFGQPYNANPKALGVPLKIISEIEERLMTRNTVEEVYAQVEKDLLESERLYKTVSADYQWDANYRASLPMAQLLLSRVYLYMENWEKAAEYAQLVMDNKNFKLLDLNNIATLDSEYNYYPYMMNYHSYANSTEAIWLYGNVRDMVGWVSDNSTDSNGRTIHPYFMASDELMDCLKESEGDLRVDRYVAKHSLYITDKDGEMVHMPQAFGKVAMQSGTNYYKPLNGGTGIFGRSLRLSEAYLNYAEAEAMRYKETGSDVDRTKSLNALNTLRKYRFSAEDYKQLEITDADELVEFTHNERRRELCYEGQRWFDLRRWGMKEIKHVWYSDANTKMIYTLSANDPQYTLPFHYNALDLNAALQQNTLGTIPRSGELAN